MAAKIRRRKAKQKREIRKRVLQLKSGTAKSRLRDRLFLYQHGAYKPEYL